MVRQGKQCRLDLTHNQQAATAAVIEEVSESSMTMMIPEDSAQEMIIAPITPTKKRIAAIVGEKTSTTSND